MGLTIYLPWPPSVNHYWRNIGRGRTIISKAGREYRRKVASIVAGKDPFAGAISVVIAARCPDWRERDVDNLPKALLDSLAAAGIIEDKHMVSMSVSKGHPKACFLGEVRVDIMDATAGSITKESGSWLK